MRRSKMKVSSPVGDFPFEPVALKVKRGHVILEGQVGAWPARVEFQPRDLVGLGRVVGARAAVAALAGVVLLARVRRWVGHGD
jgi:hypothetical protein